MVIGKYVIRKARTIKNRLINRKRGNDEDVTRLLQIYSCRIFGVCFYRTDTEFYKEKKEIFKL
jgi:hypothetical protein